MFYAQKFNHKAKLQITIAVKFSRIKLRFREKTAIEQIWHYWLQYLFDSIWTIVD